MGNGHQGTLGRASEYGTPPSGGSIGRPRGNRDLAVVAVDDAYAEHMKTLFQEFMRHLPNVADARLKFRQKLELANQARSEMAAIAGESST